MAKTIKLGQLIRKTHVKFCDFDGDKKLEVLGVSNIEGITRTTHKKSADLSNYLVIKPTSFAYNPYRINVGSIGLTPSAITGIVSPAYIVFQADEEKLIPEVLLDFLKSDEGLRQINRLARGTVRKALRYDDLCEIDFPNLSFAEQEQLVRRKAKLNTNREILLSEISHQETLLTKLKQAILQEAIQGKLTTDWRKENPAVEPAGQLLERIQKEKQRLIAEKKIRREKPLPPITPEEIPFEIPDSWDWCRFAEIGILSPRNTESDSRDSSFVPMALIFSEYGKSCQHKIRKWKEINRGYTHFRDGDVGLAKITPCFENQKSTVFRNLTGGFGAGTTELHIIRPIKIYADYILIFFKSPHYIETGIPKMTGTAGQKRVPKEYFSNKPFPLPPLAEQAAIVERTESLMDSCRQLETEIKYSRTNAENLLQAVLKEAFTSKPSESG